jgi:hypothetical protein
MAHISKSPGVSRTNRISDEGLARLENKLCQGSQISDPVLKQWIRRYGDAARAIIRAAGRYHDQLEP